MELTDQIIKKHEKIVFKSASRILKACGYQQDYTLYNDLISIGYKWLIHAIKNYKEDSKAKLSTYAYTCINFKQLDYVNKLFKESKKLVYIEEQILQSDEDRNLSNDKSRYVEDTTSDFTNQIIFAQDDEKSLIFNLYMGINTYKHTLQEIKSLFPQYSISQIKEIINQTKFRYEELQDET